jgi:hypothetical protein
MSCYRLLIAMALIASYSASAPGLEVRLLSPAQQNGSPVSPPPAINDAFPGPFLANVDNEGRLKDPKILDHALKSWAGPRLSAFLLCFQSAARPSDWRAAMHAFDNVSQYLKARGAVLVVLNPSNVCATPPSQYAGGEAHVEVLGVVRSR